MWPPVPSRWVVCAALPIAGGDKPRPFAPGGVRGLVEYGRVWAPAPTYKRREIARRKRNPGNVGAAFMAVRTPGGAQRSGSGGEEEAQRNE